MNKKNWICLSLSLLCCDQLVKAMIRASLNYGKKWTIIPKFFAITHVENQGGAFSIFSTMPWIFILISGAVCLFLLIYLWKNTLSLGKTISLVLVLSGALGNFIDRLFLGAVTDYLALTFGSYAFPVFNLADTFVVLGLFSYLGIELWRDKNGNRSY